MSGEQSRIVLLFSGKRKSGKDFIAEKLHILLQEKVRPYTSVIIRLAGPIKKTFAQDHGLNFEELMSSGPYKEQYRRDMIEWSETKRNVDYGYFCRAAIEAAGAEDHPIWIVSDCRWPTDLVFFEERFKCHRVRIVANENVRKQRGWVYQEGVDDAVSECGMDHIDHFDFVLHNDGMKCPESLLEPLVQEIKKKI